MGTMLSKQLQVWGALAFLLVATILLAGSSGARELGVLVPVEDEASARQFIASLSKSPQVQEAGLEFKIVVSNTEYPSSQIGSLVLAGKFPLALLRSSQIPGYQEDDDSLVATSLLSSPLILPDSSAQFVVEDSILGVVVEQELGSKGFAVLSFWNTAASSIVTKTSVNTAGDLMGLKISVPKMQSQDILIEMGATPVSMSADDAVLALDKGLVDASETSVESDGKNASLQTAEGGSLLAQFRHEQGFLVANEEAWLGLRQRERAAIQEAAEEAVRQARLAVLRAEADLPMLAKANRLSYLSFTTLDTEQTAARASWLRDAGSEGKAVLELLDEVQRTQPTPPVPLAPVLRSAAPARIFFATNRNDEGDPNLSYRFGVQRTSALLNCGEIEYTPEPHRAFGRSHTGGIALAGSQLITGAKSCASLVSEAARANDAVIVFIHGYNNSFDFAVRRAIAFAQDFEVKAPVLVLAWPSQDTGSGYVYDMGSVDYTRAFVKELIPALLDERLGTTSILAHSMGSRIAVQALEFAADIGKPIQNVVFVAPDVPRTNFIQSITLHGKFTQLVTLYANEHDFALKLSKIVNRQAPAGLGGANRLITQGVETIDVSAVDRQILQANHSHGFDVPKVASDVSLVLRQRSKASTRNLPSAVHNGFTYWTITP